jgi:hypothetical protein
MNEAHMPLSLAEIRRLAVNVAGDEDSRLRVVGAINAEGATDYAEVVLTRDADGAGQRRVVIGVARDASEAEVCSVLRNRLRDHLRAPR